MFFKSDDKIDTRDTYKILQEELSTHLVVTPKPTQIKVVPKNEKNTNNKPFNIKVVPNKNNKSHEWYHS
jgi:hypothetical protein